MRRACRVEVWAPALLTVAACGCTPSAANQTDAQVPETIPAVEVVQAREGTLALVERLTGTARAAGEVAIFPEASGRIAEVLVENGASVSRGQALVRIRTAGAGPQLDQARSQLAVAEALVREAQAALADLRRRLDRTVTLAERGLVSRQEVDTQGSQVEAARATVARTEAQVAAARALVAERAAAERQTTVRAPIAGRLGQRNAEVGMLVDQQTQLFVVGQLSRMRIEVPVSQDVLGHLEVGDRAIVNLADEPAIDARVSRISPFLSPGAFSAQIEIDVPNEGRLAPGMFVTVDVHYGESDVVTLVPNSALHEDPTTGEAGVFVVSAVPDGFDASQEALTKQPVDVPFHPIDVVASGRQTTGVRGVRPEAWVVVVGQQLLTASGTTPEARVRAVAWDHILSLQEVQREDLLRQFMDKQQERAEGPGRQWYE